ncbi:hypothetical protein J1614_001946 [Plenodomus biglobosus]|nr:hypothetical protein J1614_001946 [Plenodomus biglobosus]
MLPCSGGCVRVYIRRAVDAETETSLLSVQQLQASNFVPNAQKKTTTLKHRLISFKMLVDDQLTKAPIAKSGAKGITVFEPQDGLRNIMITGGGGFIIYKGDIFDDEDLSTAIMAYNIDSVIHLSAQTSVDASLANPYESSKANVVGTNIVLENCLKHGVKKFIHMSSADVYGKAKAPEGIFREDVSPRPTVGSLNESTSATLIELELIPKSVTLLQQGQKVTIHGTGADVKHWLYISDVSNAFNVILHNGVPGEVYNLGSHHASTNYNLCSSIIKAITGATDVELWMNKVPGRPVVGKPIGMDFSKLEGIGWTQRVGLEEGVAETVKWYGENAEKWWGNLKQILGCS